MNPIKFIIEANKQQVRRLLGWSETRFAEFVAAKGIQYLKDVLFADDDAVILLTKGDMFWQWWRNHWNKRDEVFLLDAAEYVQEHRIILYEELHTLTLSNYPHRPIMEQSYSLLMEQINKEAVNEQHRKETVK